jgi:hypothetical protein
MPTIKSGAFVQQCFASHPLSLSFKILTLPNRVAVACTNCHMRHRLTVRALTVRPAEANDPERDATDGLAQCGATHPAELRVSGVDVVNDAVKFRCGECRRTYHLDVAAFETYQKDS